MSIELKKANEYEKQNKRKFRQKKNRHFMQLLQWDGSMIQMDFPGIRDRFIFFINIIRIQLSGDQCTGDTVFQMI